MAPNSGDIISPVALITASFLEYPCSRYLSIFSTTTIALSTSIPMAAASPPRLIMFRFIPIIFMKMNDIRRATGKMTAVTSVMRSFRRKSKSISTVSSAPMRMASLTLFTDLLMKSVMSYHLVTFTSEGNPFSSSLQRLSTSCMMDTALVPGCFITVTSTAGFRLLSQAMKVSCMAGSISAMSFRNMGTAPFRSIMVLPTSSMLKNLLSAMFRYSLFSSSRRPTNCRSLALFSFSSTDL